VIDWLLGLRTSVPDIRRCPALPTRFAWPTCELLASCPTLTHPNGLALPYITVCARQPAHETTEYYWAQSTSTDAPVDVTICRNGDSRTTQVIASNRSPPSPPLTA
jgi:hypothetical protein